MGVYVHTLRDSECEVSNLFEIALARLDQFSNPY